MGKIEFIIKEGWLLKGFEKGTYDIKDISNKSYDCSDWYNVDVPGDVHSTLIKYNQIEDPFYGYNDIKCQWVEKKVWIYRNVINISEEMLMQD